MRKSAGRILVGEFTLEEKILYEPTSKHVDRGIQLSQPFAFLLCNPKASRVASLPEGARETGDEANLQQKVCFLLPVKPPFRDW